MLGGKRYGVSRSIVTNSTGIGEVGLTGEVRPVPFIENRIKEAFRQGFEKVILPASQADINGIPEVTLIPVENLYDFYSHIKQ